MDTVRKYFVLLKNFNWKYLNKHFIDKAFD